MSKTDSKHIKLEIESSKGTMIKSNMWLTDGMYEVEHAYYCKRCITPFPEYKYLKSFRLYLWKKFHKCEPLKIKGIENVRFSITRLDDDNSTH